LAPAGSLYGAITPRGDMAILTARGMTYKTSSDATGRTVYISEEALATPQQSAPATDLEEMRAEVVRLVNVERAKAGASELGTLSELMGCAQLKAQDFVNNDYFAHDSPTYGSASDMIRSAVSAARTVGENIAMGQRTPEQVMESWMNSDGHRRNILNGNYTHIGVGVAKNEKGQLYWVQQFVRLENSYTSGGALR
jgi:uncharacterized YkwD family protein